VTAFILFLLACFGFVVLVTMGCYLIDGKEISPGLAAAIMICAFALAIGSMGTLLNRTSLVENRTQCVILGYSDTIRYKGYWFCVEYADKKPLLIPVETIELWE
jgi:hypothetical protein